MDIDSAIDQSLAGQAETAQPAAEAQPAITNLDSISEFEFQGEKLTPDRLQEIMHGYRTLSKEQTNVEKYRSYVQNYEADVQNVLDGRASAEAFKKLYPSEFHAYLEKALRSAQGDTQQGVPKEFLNEFGQLKTEYQTLKQQIHQMAVDSANAKIEATLPKLLDKYPMAIEDQVLAKAQAYLEKGGRLNEAVWERLAKESHEVFQKKADAFYKKQLTTQIEKGKEAKDIGPGGSPPGKAPKKVTTFAEAEKAMIEHLRSQGLS